MENIELEEFIRQALEDIEHGVGMNKRSFDGPIEFEVSVTKTEKAGGKVKVYVAGAEGEITKENISKINFKVYPDYPKNKEL